MAEYVFTFKKGDIIDSDTQFSIISKIPTEQIFDNMQEIEKVTKDTEVIIRIDD
ncbi:MAG: hypothetical protein RBS57_00355 [Desulforhabdus sp.]|jgi:hypothetical protein|nr:hypothetical protein [Desulforhabdus sp.]